MTKTRPNCDDLKPLIPAYSIGATDPAETASIEAALPGCPELQMMLREYDAITDGLAQAVPQHRPPKDALDRLLTAARSTEPVQKVIRPRWVMPIVMAVAALLVLSNLGWWLYTSTSQMSIRPTPRAEDAIGLVRFDGDPAVVCIWDARTGTATLYTEGLPDLGPDESYQLWLLDDGTPQSAGVFQQGNDGRGLLIFTPPAPIRSFDAMGITREPLGGSAAPTSDPVSAVSLVES
ncbi:MAG: anti-sigma factor [Chloroflexota bacterium]